MYTTLSQTRRNKPISLKEWHRRERHRMRTAFSPRELPRTYPRSLHVLLAALYGLVPGQHWGEGDGPKTRERYRAVPSSKTKVKRPMKTDAITRRAVRAQRKWQSFVAALEAKREKRRAMSKAAITAARGEG